MARRAPRLILASALLLGSACKKDPTKAEAVDGWALARQMVLDGRHCLDDRIDYCIADPEYIDSAIQTALDKAWDGRMPATRGEVEKVVRNAGTYYRKSMEAPVGLKRIEALVRERFAAPVITRQGDTANADMGLAPGQVRKVGRTQSLRVVEVDEAAVRTAVAEQLAALGAAHPDAAILRVEVGMAGYGSERAWIYRYFTDRKQVALITPGRSGSGAWTTAPLPGGLDDLAAARVDLDRKAMKACSRSRPGSSTERWCPWQDQWKAPG